MTQANFTPHSRYQIKMLVSITLIAFLILIAAGILSFLIGLDDAQAGLVIFTIIFFCDLLFWLGGMILSVPYFRSLRYEILEDEVIVHVGIITHSVKHVPYRTVTNITVKRDILDRWFFNLGSLNIQTAGMSGQAGGHARASDIAPSAPPAGLHGWPGASRSGLPAPCKAPAPAWSGWFPAALAHFLV